MILKSARNLRYSLAFEERVIAAPERRGGLEAARLQLPARGGVHDLGGEVRHDRRPGSGLHQHVQYFFATQFSMFEHSPSLFPQATSVPHAQRM